MSFCTKCTVKVLTVSGPGVWSAKSKKMKIFSMRTYHNIIFNLNCYYSTFLTANYILSNKYYTLPNINYILLNKHCISPSANYTGLTLRAPRVLVPTPSTKGGGVEKDPPSISRTRNARNLKPLEGLGVSFKVSKNFKLV